MTPLGFLKSDNGPTTGSTTKPGSGPASGPPSTPGSTFDAPTPPSTAPGLAISSPGQSFRARLLRRGPSVSKSSGASGISGVSGESEGPPSLIANTASTSSTFGDSFEPPPISPSYSSSRTSGLSSSPRSKRFNWGLDNDGVVVVDHGLGSVPSPTRSSRSAAEHPFITKATKPNFGPSTPPHHDHHKSHNQGRDQVHEAVHVAPHDLTPAPVYPTALSPPRRPMPRSPHSILAEGYGDNSNTPASIDSPTTPGRSTVTAEWLSRKPSGRKLRESPYHPSLVSPGLIGHIRYINHGGGGGGGGVGLHVPSPRERATSTSSAEASASSSTDSGDGEIGLKPIKRRSLVGPTRDTSGSYEVQVLCTDNRIDTDEIKWQVTIRRRRSNSHSNPVTGTPKSILAPTSPLQLSTATSVAQAPSSASSINLSLSLDQPTGKLVFIAFPMDINATPRRKPKQMSSVTPALRPSGIPSRTVSPPKRNGTPPSPGPARRLETPPKRPPTPPKQIATPPRPLPLPPRTQNSTQTSISTPTPTSTSDPISTSTTRPVTPPPAPNPNASPTTPPRDFRKRVSESSMWPSPSRPGRRSPSASASKFNSISTSSPRNSGVWTPRRTRMASASDLDGGLYARGTVDGMSEELEATHLVPPPFKAVPRRL